MADIHDKNDMDTTTTAVEVSQENEYTLGIVSLLQKWLFQYFLNNFYSIYNKLDSKICSSTICIGGCCHTLKVTSTGPAEFLQFHKLGYFNFYKLGPDGNEIYKQSPVIGRQSYLFVTQPIEQTGIQRWVVREFSLYWYFDNYPKIPKFLTKLLVRC